MVPRFFVIGEDSEPLRVDELCKESPFVAGEGRGLSDTQELPGSINVELLDG